MRAGAALGLAALMLATGCGKKPVLRVADGQAMPVKAATARTQPNVQTLLTPPTESRPSRVDAFVSKSEPLQPDRFDLPPPG
jgi:hypothetical protein